MKRRFRYIFSSVIILSLLGLGMNIGISCPNVKYHKETELVSSSNSTIKESKCFYYNQYLDITVTELITKLWSNEYILYFNQKVSVKLISLTKMFCEREPVYLVFNKSYTPRKSIHDYPFYSWC